jgi:hypothetical protein
MGLLDEMQSESVNRRDRLNEVLSQLDESERDDLLAALKDRSVTTNAIVKVLKRRGIEITIDSAAGLRRRLRHESA